MLLIIDKLIYPLTLILTVIIAFALFAAVKKIRKTNRKFEIILGTYTVVHELVTLFVFYLMFGKGASMLITDLSPFVFTLSAIPLLTGKTMWLRKSLMPYLLLSGFITMSISKPGFSVPWTSDIKYLPIFIESFLTYVKHLIVLIVGLYFIFTNERYKKWDWALGFFVPATMTSWIIIATGILFWVTNNPRYGVFSTAILIPSTIQWGAFEDHHNIGAKYAEGLSETQYQYILKNYGWGDKFEKIENFYYAKYLTTNSLWGHEYYDASGTYSMILSVSKVMKVKYYWVVTILYITSVVVSYGNMGLSQIGRHKKEVELLKIRQ